MFWTWPLACLISVLHYVWIRISTTVWNSFYWLNYWHNLWKVFFFKVMASGGLYFYYLHQQFTVLNNNLLKKFWELCQPSQKYNIMEWMFPLWVSLWDQYSLLLQYGILEKLVTLMLNKIFLCNKFQNTFFLKHVNTY